MTNLSLYEITEEMEELGNSLLNGEITEDFEEKEKMLQELLIHKTDSIVFWRQKQIDFHDSIDKRIKELTQLKSKVATTIDRFDNYVISCMNKLEIKKLEGKFDKITLPKPRKAVYILNKDKIPPKYKVEKIIHQINTSKTKIKKAIESGEIVEGAELRDGKQSIKYSIRSIISG
jgi:hypothetical protein